MIQTVLCVDDELIDQTIVSHTIAEYNPSIQVTGVYDGNEALAYLKTARAVPDMILLDINMPGMSGHEFLAQYARWQTQALVVVMLTSTDQDADRRQCERYEFVHGVYIKPLTVDVIRRLDAAAIFRA